MQYFGNLFEWNFLEPCYSGIIRAECRPRPSRCLSGPAHAAWLHRVSAACSAYASAASTTTAAGRRRVSLRGSAALSSSLPTSASVGPSCLGWYVAGKVYALSEKPEHACSLFLWCYLSFHSRHSLQSLLFNFKYDFKQLSSFTGVKQQSVICDMNESLRHI